MYLKYISKSEGLHCLPLYLQSCPCHMDLIGFRKKKKKKKEKKKEKKGKEVRYPTIYGKYVILIRIDKTLSYFL